jgi:hypothetical protein
MTDLEDGVVLVEVKLWGLENKPNFKDFKGSQMHYHAVVYSRQVGFLFV